MAGWPDIVVMKSDSPEVLLAVEVKAGAIRSRDAEEELKAYMVRQSCPIGMLVTPEGTSFFRNRYTSYDPEAVQKIAECQTAELLDGIPDKASVTEEYLESRLERWLEDLREGGSRSSPPGVEEAIESLVLPALLSGVVRATGPRWRRTGS
jgi:hypothetical protein